MHSAADELLDLDGRNSQPGGGLGPIYAEPGEALTSSGPSWHGRHYISLTAVLEFGPTETLPPVGAISKHPGVSADAVAKPSPQTRAESRVLDLRKQKRERD